MLREESIIRKVKGLSKEEEMEILLFLKNNVDAWCNKNNNALFSARNFLGGDKRIWEGTPMQKLYKKYINQGLTETVSRKRAGHDAGWLLKKTIHEHDSWFDTKKTPSIRIYSLSSSTIKN